MKPTIWPVRYRQPISSSNTVEGRRLKEQTFNLTPEEAGRLRELVEINLLPENRTYRYNYVRDNCSTRCIDIVERAIGDSVYLGAPAGELAENVSFRDMMAYHHRNYPWYQFGIDLALGNGIDHTLTNRQKAFAPTVLECQAEQALRPDGTPLTLGTDILCGGRRAWHCPRPDTMVDNTTGRMLGYLCRSHFTDRRRHKPRICQPMA